MLALGFIHVQVIRMLCSSGYLRAVSTPCWVILCDMHQLLFTVVLVAVVCCVSLASVVEFQNMLFVTCVFVSPASGCACYAGCSNVAVSTEQGILWSGVCLHRTGVLHLTCLAWVRKPCFFMVGWACPMMVVMMV